MNNRLLIVDSDLLLQERLSFLMVRKGFFVKTVSHLAQARFFFHQDPFRYMIMDLKLDDGNGLDLIQELKPSETDLRILVLTSYGNIATAVQAIKYGAIDYFSKPADADELERALKNIPNPCPFPLESPMSPDRVRWEYIQRIFLSCHNNVSETARQLKMHRRTLQRILSKHPPRE